MSKHAFCIIAHKDVEQINGLLSILDHPMVDIYLHLDKKSAIATSDIEIPKQSKLYFVDRHDVRWGDISQIEAEMELYQTVASSQTDYSHVHLLSAQDMPMKTVSYMLDYFERDDNKQVEFIDYSDSQGAKNRIQYYWFGTKHMRVGLIYKIIRHSLLLAQKALHVNRLKHVDLAYKYGSNWVSLSLSAVRYLVSEYPKYQGIFKHSVCVDELYKQMLLWGGQILCLRKRELALCQV